MQLSVLLSASFAAVALASPPPINLGYFSYPHTNEFVAWSPFTPTTTQELAEVCDAQGGFKGSATWTSIRTASTYVYEPICRNPFNVTDVVTNTTYYDLELACVDDNIDLAARPEVTAVVDRATNKEIETCVPVLKEDGTSWYETCGDFRSGLNYAFACSA
ncbi:hypothetical protein ColTof4_12413 [Colletotrichum tofieldiae]|uniref:Uncharacterized protein n=1 Tax=Colletotrichum tofieldiae TaxID=708197 RepID=A0A166VTV0_9PEZI|nr:hypothetical protein CT0861_00071 [Colletotrichum tofieldiae]GKT59296.1 hypothetical protein ColTof3_06635 [Colletotrichum tofieldiae]GKT79990.1 hypothetical protein ColTof4_12413 [Colletotrichum tofieldiae]GKT85454.1 hypothetical protein Ct61P_03304 [Colletotrichum tofieldiae]